VTRLQSDHRFNADWICTDYHVAPAVEGIHEIDFSEQREFLRQLKIAGNTDNQSWKCEFKAVLRDLVSCGFKNLNGCFVECEAPCVEGRGKITRHGRKHPAFVVIIGGYIQSESPGFCKISHQPVNDFYITTNAQTFDSRFFRI